MRKIAAEKNYRMLKEAVTGGSLNTWLQQSGIDLSKLDPKVLKAFQSLWESRSTQATHKPSTDTIGEVLKSNTGTAYLGVDLPLGTVPKK